MSGPVTPVGVPIATFAQQVALLAAQYIPGASAATPTTLGTVKIGSGLSVAGDGTLSATGGGAVVPATQTTLGVVKVGGGLSVAGDGTVAATLGLGSTTGTAADGGVVAGFSASIATANSNATSALSTANGLSSAVSTNTGAITGLSTTVAGHTTSIAANASAIATNATAISAAAIKANNLSDLANASVARGNLGLGTAATYAAGGNSGVALLDGTGNVTANKLIPTNVTAAAISIGDYTGNLALAGNAYLTNTLALNTSYAGVAVSMAQVSDTQLITNITAITGGNANITNFAHGVGTGAIAASTRSTFVGFGAGNAAGSVFNSPENTFGGFGSGNAFGSGNTGTNGYNAAWGSKTLFNLQDGQFNAALGQGAGSALQNYAVGNVCIGHGTISGYDYGVTNPATGILNTGYVAANHAVGNTCVGTYAGQTITSGAYNACFGYASGEFLSGGSGLAAYNTFAGAYSGLFVVTGVSNVGLGAYTFSAASNTTSYCVAVGRAALQNITTNNHVAVGYQAAQSATSAQRMAIVGYQGVNNLIDGNNNVGLGWSVGLNLVHGNQCIYIGSSVGDLAVFNGVGNISDGGGVNPGTVLTITSVGTKNSGYNVGDYISGIGVTTVQITAILTGTGGPGTYQLSGSAQLVAAGTVFQNRDYNNTVAIGYNVEPTASNQILFGNGSVTQVAVGGSVGGLMNVGNGIVALGNQSLAAATSSVNHAIAVGAFSGQYASAVTSSVFIGDNNAWNFLAGSQNIIIGVSSATNGWTAKGTISATTLTVTARINGSNAIIAGPLYIGGVKVANILAYGTAGTSGTGASGTYALDTSLTYATVTQMAGSDYSNVTMVASGTNPTASNQAIFGNGSTTAFSVGGTPGNGMMYLNSGWQIGIGPNALAAATLSSTTTFHQIAIGFNAAKLLNTGDYITAIGHGALGAITSSSNCAVVGYLAYANATGGRHAGMGSNVGAAIVTATDTVMVGNSANATGDFGNLVVLGSAATANAAGQIVIGYNVTATADITIGLATKSTAIAGAFTMAAGATGAAVFGGLVTASGGFSGAHNGTVGATTPNTGAFTSVTATLASVFSSTVQATAYKAGAVQVVGPRITGWGTSTNGVRGAINGSTATLAQVSAFCAQLATDLIGHGLIYT